MDENKPWWSKFLAKIKNTNKIKAIVVVICIVAILLIFASSFVTKNKGVSEQSSENVETNFRSMEYCKVVENRIENVLANVKGIGNVKAFVMVDSSPTLKYLEETNNTNADNGGNSSSTNQTTIYEARNGTIYSPVVVVEMLPKIIGVLIVATGAKDIQMKAMLINVVASVLNVNVSSVEVLEGK